MIDQPYMEKMSDLETWSSWNSSDGNVVSDLGRDLFLFHKLRGFVAAIVEYVSYQQQLEGRTPGDPDEISTFPFPDSLADKKRLSSGSSLIIPVKIGIVGNGVRT